MLTGRRGVVAPYVRDILRQNNLFGKRIVGPITAKKFPPPNDNHPDENLPTGHEEYYVGDHIEEPDFPTVQGKRGPVKDGSTFTYKTYIIEKLIARNGGAFETIELWDDRKEHIDLFKAFAQRLLKAGKAQNFLIHQVYAPYPGSDAQIVHMPVTLKTTW